VEAHGNRYQGGLEKILEGLRNSSGIQIARSGDPKNIEFNNGIPPQNINPILHTTWLNNHAPTMKSNTSKYYFGEISSFYIFFKTLDLMCKIGLKNQRTFQDQDSTHFIACTEVGMMAETTLILE
jgi:hypothetical protein